MSVCLFQHHLLTYRFFTETTSHLGQKSVLHKHGGLFQDYSVELTYLSLELQNHTALITSFMS